MKEYVSYFASKAGVVSLSKSLGSKAIVDKENIRVDCVCPCYADTAMVTEDPVRRGRGSGRKQQVLPRNVCAGRHRDYKK